MVADGEASNARAPRRGDGLGVAVFGGSARPAYPDRCSISWLLALTHGLIYSIIFLSLVILTGYSGQISLGHTAFMGIAAFTTAHLVSGAGHAVGGVGRSAPWPPSPPGSWSG